MSDGQHRLRNHLTVFHLRKTTPTFPQRPLHANCTGRSRWQSKQQDHNHTARPQLSKPQRELLMHHPNLQFNRHDLSPPARTHHRTQQLPQLRHWVVTASGHLRRKHPILGHPQITAQAQHNGAQVVMQRQQWRPTTENHRKDGQHSLSNRRLQPTIREHTTCGERDILPRPRLSLLHTNSLHHHSRLVMKTRSGICKLLRPSRESWSGKNLHQSRGQEGR